MNQVDFVFSFFIFVCFQILALLCVSLYLFFFSPLPIAYVEPLATFLSHVSFFFSFPFACVIFCCGFFLSNAGVAKSFFFFSVYFPRVFKHADVLYIFFLLFFMFFFPSYSPSPPLCYTQSTRSICFFFRVSSTYTSA